MFCSVDLLCKLALFDWLTNFFLHRKLSARKDVSSNVDNSAAAKHSELNALDRLLSIATCKSIARART